MALVIRGSAGAIDEGLSASTLSGTGNLNIWSDGAIVKVNDATSSTISGINFPNGQGDRRFILLTAAMSIAQGLHKTIPSYPTTTPLAINDIVEVFNDSDSINRFIVNSSAYTYDYGSNSNGYYLKFYDGTMIQWHDYSVYLGITSSYNYMFYVETIWSYPTTFYSNDIFYTSSAYTSGHILFTSAAYYSRYTNAASFFISDLSSSKSDTTYIKAFAIGRWKDYGS